MAPNPDERHYNINKLNFIFAIASVVLLVSVVWLFTRDYARKWKDYQEEYRDREVEKTRIKYDAADKALQGNAEYQENLKILESARKEYKDKCLSQKELRRQIVNLQSQDDLIQQQYKFNKAKLDAARYRYEESKSHGKAELAEDEKNFRALLEEDKKLKLKVEDSVTALNAKKNVFDDCGEQLKDLEKKQKQVAQQEILLKRKLAKIDGNEMSFANQMASIVRDLPVIDLANPKNKIEQAVLGDIHDDVNFMSVPKVDRCITCHLGISNPDYKDAEQPYRTHPRLELFVDSNSPHPLEEFGCTVCHGGRGRGTSFNSAAHIPHSPEQKAEWEKKYGWKRMDLWDDPMLPLPYVEAGCFKCHSSQTTFKGAEKLNLGLHLIEKSGCYGCHTIDKYKNWPKAGPDLTKVATKVSKQWAYKWIKDPKSFRHNTWMPSYFNQANSSDPRSIERTQQEIHAMVHYLFVNSDEFKMDKMPYTGDAENGEKLVSSLGCFGCHQQSKTPQKEPLNEQALRRQHGPNLINLGSKTGKDWIFSWIKNPNRYHPETRMPNLRLSDQEAADIAEYLGNDKSGDFDSDPVPSVNEQVVNEITLEFLTRTETARAAQEKLKAMNLDEKLTFSGQKLISFYGCFGCHKIAGFETAKPIGTELTEEGNKPVHNLDFGFIHIDHTRQAWFKEKLKNPRVFDEGRVKEPLEKLHMPNFNFTDEEADAITTAILGFVNDKLVKSKVRRQTAQTIMLDEGQKIVRQMNCQGCHMIEGDGAAISPSIRDWLVKYDNRSEADADAIIRTFSPPNLIGEGQKVQADWLFDFLHSPTPIRPWLKVRMPTYGFNAVHLNALVKYFNALDNTEFPFTEKIDMDMPKDELAAAEKLFSKDYFGCTQCHIVGDKMPSGSADSWAPDFALVKARLKPDWIIKWLRNPAELLPGTKMPTYFDPTSFDASGPEDILNGDENTQIRVLRDYIMSITQHQSAQPLNPSPVVTEPAGPVAPAAGNPDTIPPAPSEVKK